MLKVLTFNSLSRLQKFPVVDKGFLLAGPGEAMAFL